MELVGRLLDVIEHDVVPLTAAGVARGDKLFGGAIRLKDDLSVGDHLDRLRQRLVEASPDVERLREQVARLVTTCDGLSATYQRGKGRADIPLA